MSESKFIIGIDLGTTNSTLAFSSLEEGGGAQIHQFLIPQLMPGSMQGEAPSLPSFIYFPLAEELKTLQDASSSLASRSFCVGAFARDRGGELPSQLIASSKSWLCHAGINRREAILPFASDDVAGKMSPLDACSELLRHLREAWESKMDIPFAEQQVLVTVPASFDPSARQFVQEAAERAGYPDILLLEEPQAAFYAWLNAHADDWRQLLQVGDRILVVDIGGGTTDFSLIAVDNQDGDLALQRVAVGSHLLLGGDNIDLSLAYRVKNSLESQGHVIDDWQLQSLIHSCRRAKESLLGENPPKHVDVTVLGRGSRLVGGALKTKLTLADVRASVLDGFAPLVSPQERSSVERRSGLQQVGLPYAQDARFTCQLAKFLSMTGEREDTSMDNFIMPSAVLFNGGTTQSAALRERLIEQLNQWAAYLDKPAVKVLPDADYSFAVSRGAVSYGKARTGSAIRIKSGTNRSFFIGVEEARLAIPGMQPQIKAVCVAPFGMEEGSELQLDNQEFALVIGKLATFRFFSHAAPKLLSGATPEMGSVVRQWSQELTELHPIEALLDSSDGDGMTIRIKIRSRVTELGVLEVWCIAHDGRQWKLEFDIRKEGVLI